MNIPFEGQISKRDLTEIYTLAMDNQRWLAYVFGPQFFVYSAMLIFSILNDVYSPLWLIAVVISGVLASCPFWLPVINANSTHKRQPELLQTYSGEVSEDEVILRIINATSNVKWTLFKSIVRNPHYVLLYQSTRLFSFIPRRCFSTDEDWQQINKLLDQKVKTGELKEATGKVDLSLGTTLPGWLMLLFIMLLTIPFVAFIRAIVIGVLNAL